MAEAGLAGTRKWGSCSDLAFHRIHGLMWKNMSLNLPLPQFPSTSKWNNTCSWKGCCEFLLLDLPFLCWIVHLAVGVWGYIGAPSRQSNLRKEHPQDTSLCQPDPWRIGFRIHGSSLAAQRQSRNHRLPFICSVWTDKGHMQTFQICFLQPRKDRKVMIPCKVTTF